MRPTRIVDQRTEVGTQNFELLHNGLLTLLLDDYRALSTIITLVLL
ncbi:unnamed protein product [Callosobruchus maculatus]|uniref:Uncharacterized protein n=1 Tax=Callosobruchus maculatus TaxID=64391 RepID=A0A653DE16_CALMS|nr:unnamed protein product [Callosobruchus maculatus]